MSQSILHSHSTPEPSAPFHVVSGHPDPQGLWEVTGLLSPPSLVSSGRVRTWGLLVSVSGKGVPEVPPVLVGTRELLGEQAPGVREGHRLYSNDSLSELRFGTGSILDDPPRDPRKNGRWVSGIMEERPRSRTQMDTPLTGHSSYRVVPLLLNRSPMSQTLPEVPRRLQSLPVTPFTLNHLPYSPVLHLGFPVHSCYCLLVWVASGMVGRAPRTPWDPFLY